MTKYKIVGTDEVAATEDPTVELRLDDGGGSLLRLQGRNPGGAWHTILYLDENGKAALLMDAQNIQGIAVDSIGHIKTY